MGYVAGIDITCGRAAMEVRDGAGRPRLCCTLTLPVRFNGVCESRAESLIAAIDRLLDAAVHCGVDTVCAVCDTRAVLAADIDFAPVSDVMWEEDMRGVRERNALGGAAFVRMGRAPAATDALCKALWTALSRPEIFAHTAAFVSPAMCAVRLARLRGFRAVRADRYGAAAALLRLMPEVAATADDRLMMYSRTARRGLFDTDPFDGGWRLTVRLPDGDAQERAFFIRARLEEAGGVRQINAACDGKTCRVLADAADTTVLRTEADVCLTGAAMLAARAAGIGTDGITPRFTEEYAPDCPSRWDVPYIVYCVDHAYFAKSLYL